MIKPLYWDSNFFDLEVGETFVSSLGNVGLLDFGSYDLVYVVTDKPDLELGNALANINVKFINHRVDLELELGEQTIKPESISDYCGGNEKINDLLVSLGLQSGEFSRFKMDKSFEESGKFTTLYEKWVLNSIDKSIADYTLIYRENEQPLGILTLRTKGKAISEIGLLAVSQETRGKGIGKKLMQAAVFYSISDGCRSMTVSTQLENTKAVDFYEHLGFKRYKTQKIFHYWKR